MNIQCDAFSINVFFFRLWSMIYSLPPFSIIVLTFNFTSDLWRIYRNIFGADASTWATRCFKYCEMRHVCFRYTFRFLLALKLAKKSEHGGRIDFYSPIILRVAIVKSIHLNNRQKKEWRQECHQICAKLRFVWILFTHWMTSKSTGWTYFAEQW